MGTGDAGTGLDVPLGAGVRDAAVSAPGVSPRMKNSVMPSGSVASVARPVR